MTLTNILSKLTNGFSTPSTDADFPRVDLFYWTPAGNQHNFGDHLSKIIVTKLLAEHGHVLDEETPSAHTLFAVGSILHFAQSGDVVWGSGVNGKIAAEEHRFDTLDIRAVRGPLTRSFLQDRGIAVPEVYGDPALLLPTLFRDRFVTDTQQRYVFVPNLHDLEGARAAGIKHIVSPLTTWNTCIKEILKGEMVIASSLHGLIIAEAYGLPARYLRLSEEENIFKYRDYVMGTGRADIEVASSIEEALEMGGMPPPVFDAQKLLAAFPLDLWEPTAR